MALRKEHLHTFLNVGVDVISIIKDPDIVFGGEQSLHIEEVLDEVIALRGSNFTTVKDLCALEFSQMWTCFRSISLVFTWFSHGFHWFSLGAMPL